MGSKPKHRTARPKMAGTKKVLAQNVEKTYQPKYPQSNYSEHWTVLGIIHCGHLRRVSFGAGAGRYGYAHFCWFSPTRETVAWHQHMWCCGGLSFSCKRGQLRFLGGKPKLFIPTVKGKELRPFLDARLYYLYAPLGPRVPVQCWVCAFGYL